MERKIKNTGFKVDQNETFINPNTLALYVNEQKNPICPSKYWIIDGILNFDKNKKCSSNISKEDARKFMLYPYTVLDSNELLKVYKILNFEELFEKVVELTDDGQKFTTINRILNSTIKNTFEELKTQYQFLAKIYNYLINKFYPKNKINNSDIEMFIKKWFNNNSSNNFNLNLGEEIIKNLL